MRSTTELLDLVGGQRASSFRFVLLDAELRAIGELHPELGASISNDGGAAIKRKIDGIVLTEQELSAIDPFEDRVRLEMVLENGARLPWGVFMFTDFNRLRRSVAIVDTESTLVDQALILDQPIETNFSVRGGSLVRDGIMATLARVPPVVGLYAVVDGSTEVVAPGAPLSWAAGQATWWTVLSALAQLGVYWPPYFDNEGRLRLRSVAPIAEAPVAVRYDVDDHIFEDSIVETDALLDTPDRYLVVSSSSGTAAVVGRYDVPLWLPPGVERRTWQVTKVVTAQGIATQEQAIRMAEAAAVTNSWGHLVVSFTGPPDPRHDTFDVVQYGQIKMWERKWDCDLVDGGDMGHELQLLTRESPVV